MSSAMLENDDETSDLDNDFDVQEQVEFAKKEGEGRPVHIHTAKAKLAYYGPADDRKPTRIFVAGTHSDRYRAKQREIDRRKVRQGSFKMEQAKDNTIELAVACTLGWEGLNYKGAPLAFNAHNAEMIYRKCPWVLDEVQEAMTDHEGFFETSSPELLPT